MDQVGELIGRYGIGVELGYGRIIPDGDAPAECSRHAEAFAAFVETVCRPLGVRTVGVVSPFHGGRWLREPPLAKQMERLVEGLKLLAPVAERYGVYLAVENHADYRGREVVEIIEHLGSRNVGIKFDTGNTYCAMEEPLEAADAVVAHTIMTHIKDVIVEAEPCNRGLPGGLLALAECPLGQGHVDLCAIVRMLAERNPFGSDLVLTIECRHTDVEASVRWDREHLAPYLG